MSAKEKSSLHNDCWTGQWIRWSKAPLFAGAHRQALVALWLDCSEWSRLCAVRAGRSRAVFPNDLGKRRTSDGHPDDESAGQRLVESKIERLLQPAQFWVGININRRHQKNFDRLSKPARTCERRLSWILSHPSLKNLPASVIIWLTLAWFFYASGVLSITVVITDSIKVVFAVAVGFAGVGLVFIYVRNFL